MGPSPMHAWQHGCMGDTVMGHTGTGAGIHLVDNRYCYGTHGLLDWRYGQALTRSYVPAPLTPCLHPAQLCLGLRHVKPGLLKADESQRLPPDISGYRFGCFGYSAHPYERQGDQNGGTKGLLLPYCEGIEVRDMKWTARPGPCQPSWRGGIGCQCGSGIGVEALVWVWPESGSVLVSIPSPGRTRVVAVNRTSTSQCEVISHMAPSS